MSKTTISWTDRLEAPLHWKKPRMIFVNSMSDLFHEEVPVEFIDRIFAVMALCPQHTFQILTKRAKRMAEYFNRSEYASSFLGRLGTAFIKYRGHPITIEEATSIQMPLSNVWLGVSCEDQQRADERIPQLLKCPAAVRFLSVEPLLGPIDFDAIHVEPAQGFFGNPLQWYHRGECHKRAGIEYPTISWVIVGCESGPGRRNQTDYPDQALSIIRQCRAAGVKVFVKQMPIGGKVSTDPAEWPEEFRMQQFPK